MSIINKEIEHKIVKTDSGCWIWTGATHRQGYPMSRDPRNNKQGMVLVSRLLMQNKLGYTLTKDQRVKNTCGNKLCVNPEHYIVAEFGTEEWKCIAHKIPEEKKDAICKEWQETEYYHGKIVDIKDKYKIHHNTLTDMLKKRGIPVR